MKTNMGTLDRVVRIFAGGGLVAAASFGIFGGWAWIGAILIGTAALGFCPLYTLLHLNTKGK